MQLNLAGVKIDTTVHTTPLAVAAEWAKHNSDLQGPDQQAKINETATALAQALGLNGVNQVIHLQKNMFVVFDSGAFREVKDAIAPETLPNPLQVGKAPQSRQAPPMPDGLEKTVSLLTSTESKDKLFVSGGINEGELLSTLGYEPANINPSQMRREILSGLKDLQAQHQQLEGTRAAVLAELRQEAPGLLDAQILPNNCVACVFPGDDGPQLWFWTASDGQYRQTPPQDTIPSGTHILASRSGNILWAHPNSNQATFEAPNSVLNGAQTTQQSLGNPWSKLLPIDRQISELTQQAWSQTGSVNTMANHLTELRLEAAGCSTKTAQLQFRQLQSQLTSDINDVIDLSKAWAKDDQGTYDNRQQQLGNNKLKVDLTLPRSAARKQVLKLMKKHFTKDVLEDPTKFQQAMSAYRLELQAATSLDGAVYKAAVQRRQDVLSTQQEKLDQSAFFGRYANKEIFRFDQGAYRRPGSERALLTEMDSGGVCLALAFDWCKHGDIRQDQNDQQSPRGIFPRHVAVQASHSIQRKEHGRITHLVQVAIQNAIDRPGDAEVQRALDRAVEDYVSPVPLAFARSLGYAASDSFASREGVRYVSLKDTPGANLRGLIEDHAQRMTRDPHGVGAMVLNLQANPTDDDSGAGHAVAVRFVPNGNGGGEHIEVFDPNVGSFRFNNMDELQAWADDWQRAFYNTSKYDFAGVISLTPQ